MTRWLLALMIAACTAEHQGSLDEPCESDGKCNGSLTCKVVSYNGLTGSPRYKCNIPVVPFEERCRTHCAMMCGDAGIRTIECEPANWTVAKEHCECR